MKRLFTSESVTEGHPDKVCDQIADAILDAILAQDPRSRVACEVTATTDKVFIMGEITTSAVVDVEKVARETIKKIGYEEDGVGFDYRTCEIVTNINKQSADIAMGVDSSIEHKESGSNYDTIGAGDQGMMFGYACNETDAYMPLAIYYAHALTKKLADVRKQGLVDYLRPDGKAQVTVEYNDGVATRIEAVVVSTQHNDKVDIETLRKDVKSLVIDAVIPADLIDSETKYYINPTGRFVIGGPAGDSGLTGRKIIVDTYGGYAAHGGGSFSGKDPTKVDRSATYFARYVAKNVVAAGLADRCELQVAYAIGKANPVSVSIDTFGTGKLTDEELSLALTKVFDFRPLAIIDKLGLAAPVYADTASYGHFGKAHYNWEKLDKVDELKALLK